MRVSGSLERQADNVAALAWRTVPHCDEAHKSELRKPDERDVSQLPAGLHKRCGHRFGSHRERLLLRSEKDHRALRQRPHEVARAGGDNIGTNGQGGLTDIFSRKIISVRISRTRRPSKYGESHVGNNQYSPHSTPGTVDAAPCG
jgi:hypothetical protein